ncbi:Major facilitator superfamily (MFS) profile domain-containing protein [Caenorhabditis elegans]|uniref:Major facilitator superfamily (MFS) profile domain-containing protein n=1 Tax=Caenorhabditis elegans TaxID=6239 RepID=Q94305_CAEEL|nr:Major facilitator superfamily (MFS) profile domain-containing protein [Caenorhabditis elegans]CCD70904.1 Major facilitator superfamily (MFS) profile domain-containing protein [Caenorhabditis elegans]|eukprot:NP_504013.1 Uncharacterized protein CELE_T22F3.8 [Caenorhabditis elegans]
MTIQTLFTLHCLYRTFFNLKVAFFLGSAGLTMMLLNNYYRFIVLLVGFLCLASLCSNYLIINFTFICMKHDFSDGFTEINGTRQSIYDYTPDDKKWILWAVAAGTIIGTVPMNLLLVKYGARFPFFLSGIVSCISTSLIPFAAKWNFAFLIILRFIQGFSFSADFAAIGLLAVRWAPLAETAIFVAVLTCFNAIASMITNMATGLICVSSLGWKWSYYLHSIVGAILFVLWYFVYIDHPQDTRRVSGKELQSIQKNKSEAHLSKKCDVPYIKLATSPVILCVWANAFFDLTAAIMFSTYIPLYLHEVLKFGVTETGFYSSLIHGICLPVRLCFGIISDKIQFISEPVKIQIFNTISVGGSGLFFASIGLIPMEYRGWSVFSCIMTMSCIGVNPGGFYKVAVLHSRQFAHVVLTAIQWIKCLALFVAPALVSIFVTNESIRQQWIWVFLIVGGGMVITNILGFFFLTDKPAEWTDTDEPLEKL